ncbi:hypothetical protein HY477_02570 [Candidatus Uhrbacteria bacterium]|nr:hypothetical protein [Candidatus Uhrbacteria bacterium]
MSERPRGLAQISQAMRLRHEYSPEDVENLTKIELYGHDEPKTSFGVFGRTLFVSKAVAILANAKDEDIIPICSALLARFGLKMDASNRGNFFSGDTNVLKPGDMKYAFLRLLGITTNSIRASFGYKELGGSRTLSSNFEDVVASMQIERNIFPLKNPEQFPKIQAALARIKRISPKIDTLNIFERNRIPPASSWMNRGSHTSRLLLHEALSALAEGLKGTMDSREVSTSTNLQFPAVSALLRQGEKSPLTPAVHKLLKENREKYLKLLAGMKATKQGAPKVKRRWF